MESTPLLTFPLTEAIAQSAPSSTWSVGQLTRYVDETLRLNPQQRAACFSPIDQGLQVLAGAGTGKTLLITARTLFVLDGLLAQGLPHAESRVLVLTFTDKAAGEMRERIHKHLRAGGYQGPLPSATVATFHTFCYQLLQRHGLAKGFVDGLTLVEGADQEAIHQRVQASLAKGLMGNIATALADSGLDTMGVPVDVLSLTSLKALPTPDKMKLIASFAGLVEQIKSFGVSPTEFLALIQTQNPAWTVAAAYLPQDDPSTGGPLADKESLLHAWAGHLKAWADPAWFVDAREPGLKYGDYVDLLGAVYKGSGWFDTKASRANKLVWYPDVPPSVQSLGALADSEQAMAQAVAAYYALYQQTLRREGLLDFNDLINEAILRLEGDEALRTLYADWFVHVLVDEFQDTNAAQLRLLRLLLKPSPTCNLTVVGDEKQSIYGFRFAQKENLSLIFQGYPAPARIALQTNYRSSPPVVAVANQLAHLLTQGDRDQQLASGVAPTELTTGKAVTFFNLGRPLPPNTPGGKAGKESSGRVSDREDRLIVAEIVRLLTQEGLEPNHIAVLLPTHGRANSLASRLAEVGVPFLRSRDSAFFEEPTVKNAVAVLRLLVDPEDRQALARVLALRLNQAQVWAVLRWLRHQQGLPSAEWLARLADCPIPLEACPELSGAYQTGVQALARQLLYWHRQRLGGHPLTLLQQVLATLEVVPPGLSQEQHQQEQLTLKQVEGLFRQMAKPLGANVTLAGLAQALSEAMTRPDFKLDGLVKDTANGLQAVRLLTFHASKGLEFEAVFVSWTHDGVKAKPGQLSPLLFDPQTEAQPGFGLMWRKLEGHVALKPMLHEAIWAKPRRMAEAQRLFYVALTRAKQRLYVFRREVSATPWTLPNALHSLPNTAVWDEQDPEQVALLEAGWLAPTPSALRLQVAPFRLQWQPSGGVIDHRSRRWPGVSATHWAGGAPAVPPQPVVQSVSALEQLSQCPTQFWWHRVARAPQPPATTASKPLLDQALAALRGKALHRAVETAYRLPDIPAEQWLATIWQHTLGQNDTPELVMDESAERERLRGVFAQFEQSPFGWQTIRAKGQQVIAPELVVRWHTPLTVPTAQGPAPLIMQGQVDALFFDPRQESYTLVDFKTNSRLTPALQAKYAQQLAVYQAALQANNPAMALPNAQVQLVHLPPEGGHYRVISLDELPHQPAQSWLSDHVPSLARVLEATAPPDPDKADLPCASCGYRPLCPFAQASLSKGHNE
jgi:superfamily I DNA/RNA helicase